MARLPWLDRLRGRFRNRLSEDKRMIPHMAQSHQRRFLTNPQIDDEEICLRLAGLN
jgi:hypothetical protein